MRALLVLILAIPAYVALAQRPTGDGADGSVRIIRGQVRSDDDSATLLRRARVTVAGIPVPVFTDQDGRFEVAVPAATTAILRITKPGFAPTQIPLSATSGTDPLQIRLARGAAVVGRVLDELGWPVVGVDVRVRRLVDDAERGVVSINRVVETDDLGEFRVGSLPAGAYAVSVERSPARVTGINPTGGQISESVIMNPDRAGAPLDASSPQKSTFTLRAGEEAEAALFYEFAGAEARSAAAYVSEYVAAERQAEIRARGVAGLLSRATAVVTGRVTAPNGRGVAGAIVRLNPASAGTGRIAASDAQGQFVFTGVPAGAYRVVVTKTGLIAGEYGQDRVGQPGKVVTLRDRQRLDRVDIGMWRGAVVTGTVTDQDGEPLEGLAMHVWGVRYWNGRRITEAPAGVFVRRSDDRGQYRIHGLQPGTYYVVASDDPSPSAREVTGAPRSYYPGTPTIGEASTIRVGVGLDADIHMTFNPARTFRLAGLALDSEGVLLTRPLVLAGSTRAGVATAPQTATMNGPSFTFEHVVPGSYVIHAIQRREDSGRLVQEYGRRFVEIIDSDNTGLQLTTFKGASITGRITFEGDRTADSGSSVRFDIVSADPDFAPPPGQFVPWTVRSLPGGYFQIDGLSGPVRFTSSAAPGWFLKSVDLNGRNAADEPVTFGAGTDSRGQVNVVFSSAGAEISGRVVNGRNEPVGTYVVIALPVDRNRWYNGSRFIKLAHPDEEARFSLGMLPPGNYWVAAVDALPDESLEDPDLLERLSTIGRRTTLISGQRLVTDLPLAATSR